MAGAYAKEFEKWLQGSSSNTEETLGDMEDSNDEVEPPILEPVRFDPTKVSKDSTVSDNYNHQELRNVKSSVSQIHPEEMKFEACKKDNAMNVEEDKSCYYSKSDKSENIFDKFTLLSETDDFPPPLIPSHEAHLTTVDAKDDDSHTEKSYATLQNLSPNFCAMEADSTSEMMKGSENNSKERSGKAPISNDIGMECDSTCMLSVSPHMVSPGSTLESDNPNTPYSIDVSTDGNPPIMPWNSFSSRETTYSSLIPFSEHTNFDYRNNFLSSDSAYTGDVYHRDSGEWDRECPKLEAVHVGEVNDTSPFVRNAGVEDLHEPPVLSVVPPPSLITPRMAARRKRHTIDTVESVSRKHKTHSKDTSRKKGLLMGPTSSRPHKDSLKKDESISVSKRKESSVSKSHPRPKKPRERCKTLHIVDLISYSNHLPKDLYEFVVTSSQLSFLQNRMHQLLHLLFPQLTAALKSMSPESSQFETLLKDLVHYLKEPCSEPNSKSGFHNIMKCSGEATGFISDSNQSVINKDDINVSAPKLCGEVPVQTLVSDSDDDAFLKPEHCEDNQCSRVTNDDINTKDLSQHSSQSSLSNCSQSHMVKPDLEFDATSCKSVIPGFSRLNLNKENESILKRQPSVLIHKNPETLHRNFCKLSCRALQLLLPDLNVDLMKEFSNSPKDLLLFIDSVISSNTQADL